MPWQEQDHRNPAPFFPPATQQQQQLPAVPPQPPRQHEYDNETTSSTHQPTLPPRPGLNGIMTNHHPQPLLPQQPQLLLLPPQQPQQPFAGSQLLPPTIPTSVPTSTSSFGASIATAVGTVMAPNQNLLNTTMTTSGSSWTGTQSNHPHPTTTRITPQVVVGNPAPIFNGINPHYPAPLRVLHQDPPIFMVDDFLSLDECQFLIDASQDSWTPAPVVGKGAGEVSPSRTSSTCYLARQDLPDLMRKVSLLTGKPIEHCELPQVGRYLATQQYLQHYDAFDLDTEDGRRFASNGGQRTVTVLVYLNDVPRGGQTYFPSLSLSVAPRKGSALVFFPATVDGHLDPRALHAALPAVDVKYVSQIWIRQSVYDGTPSKRLAYTMGKPF